MGILLLMEEILHQLIGSLSHYLQGFIHPRWCKISAINSRIMVVFSRTSDTPVYLDPVSGHLGKDWVPENI